MDVTPLVKTNAQIVQSYADGCFKISGQSYDGAILVMADCSVPWGFSKSISDIQLDDFAVLEPYAKDLDVVLLGTGERLQFIPPILRQKVKERYGVNIEMMDTGAACRTYNVLMAEGRRVAAVMLPV